MQSANLSYKSAIGGCVPEIRRNPSLKSSTEQILNGNVATEPGKADINRSSRISGESPEGESSGSLVFRSCCKCGVIYMFVRKGCAKA